jgi:photosystem II stability/assembly factor-like uncharacterized protein
MPSHWEVINSTARMYTAISISNDGLTILAAVSSSNVYISRDGGTTMDILQISGTNVPSTTNIGISGDGLKMMVTLNSRIYYSSDGGYVWGELQPLGNVTRTWNIRMSSDGTRFIATNTTELRVYISSNSGSSWSQTYPKGDVTATWLVYISKGGTGLLCTEASGYPYSSSDFGDTWTSQDPVGMTTTYWKCAISDDAQKIIVTINTAQGAYLARYTMNGGVSWVNPSQITASTATWQIVDVSGDGQNFLAGNVDLLFSDDGGLFLQMPETTSNTTVVGSLSENGRVAVVGRYTSTGGSMYRSMNLFDAPKDNISRLPSRPQATNKFYYASSKKVVASSDKQYIVHINDRENPCVSNNGGETWYLPTIGPVWPDSYSNYYGIAGTPNGQILVVIVLGGRVYRSTDYGANWTELQPEGDINQNWTNIAMDSSGQKIWVTGSSSSKLSTNGGSSWNDHFPDGGSTIPYEPVISDDGTVMAARVSSRLLVSTNGGSSYNEKRPAGDVDVGWYVSLSGDGQSIFTRAQIAGTWQLFVSTNIAEDTWIELSPFASHPTIVGVISSYDGNIIIVGSNTLGSVYSKDGGQTWHELDSLVGYPISSGTIYPNDDPPTAIIGSYRRRELLSVELSEGQYSLPQQDITIDGFTDENLTTTDLYLKIADDSDTTLIQAIATATPKVYETLLAAIDNPQTYQGIIVEMRYQKDYAAGYAVDLNVKLMCGTTQIAEWTYLNIPNGWTDAIEELTWQQAAAIANWSDLRLRWTVTQGT